MQSPLPNLPFVETPKLEHNAVARPVSVHHAVAIGLQLEVHGRPQGGAA